ncbi:hypothetical protein ABEF95_005386 [Exophiala dermatitidis]
MGSLPNGKDSQQQWLDQIPEEWRLSSAPLDPDVHDSRDVIQHLLTAKELDITNTVGVRRILRRYEEGHWTVEEVVRAFCKRTAIATQLLGCCTELMFESAIAQARELDRWYAETGQLVGPLHGIPLSLGLQDEKSDDDRSRFHMHLGNDDLEDDDEEEIAVSQLRRLGAILYAQAETSAHAGKSSLRDGLPKPSSGAADDYNSTKQIPQHRSLNALNDRLASSGGIGALVGSRGSILGFGTDSGGAVSIRIPAASQGLYALCPSVGRLPSRESRQDQKYTIFRPVAGPLSNSLGSLELFMQAYMSMEPWTVEPSVVPIPWRYELAEPPKTKDRSGSVSGYIYGRFNDDDDVDDGEEDYGDGDSQRGANGDVGDMDLVLPRALRIAVVVDDGVLMPHLPIVRAVRELAGKLRQCGHEVVEWDTLSHRAAYYDLWLPATVDHDPASSVGNRKDGSTASDTPGAQDGTGLANTLANTHFDSINDTAAHSHNHNQTNTGSITHPHPHPQSCNPHSTSPLDVRQRIDLATQIWKFRRTYLRRWRESDIDALVMPVTPWVGMPSSESRNHSTGEDSHPHSELYFGYTSIWSLLDYTVLTMPVATVDPVLDDPRSQASKTSTTTNTSNNGDSGNSSSAPLENSSVSVGDTPPPTTTNDSRSQANHSKSYADLWDSGLIQNMPINVQIVTGRFGEEKAFAVAKVLEQLP